MTAAKSQPDPPKEKMLVKDVRLVFLAGIDMELYTPNGTVLTRRDDVIVATKGDVVVYEGGSL